MVEVGFRRFIFATKTPRHKAKFRRRLTLIDADFVFATKTSAFAKATADKLRHKEVKCTRAQGIRAEGTSKKGHELARIGTNFLGAESTERF